MVISTNRKPSIDEFILLLHIFYDKLVIRSTHILIQK